MHRRTGVLAAGIAAGALGFAGPAAADVTVNPPSAAQGSGENIAFHVTNTAQSPITQVKLVLPREIPVAEVYPLSVDDWAPKIELMDLASPLTSIHGGTPVTETAASITWIAMPGKALQPGASTDLSVAMGPMPTDKSAMGFTLEPTYQDPAKGAPLPQAVLELTPSTGEAATGHTGHGTTGTGTGTQDATDAATIAALAEASDDGPGLWSVAGWVIAGLGGAAALVMALRNRRAAATGAADAAEQSKDKDKELVAAGKPRVTAWSYQDGPEE